MIYHIPHTSTAIPADLRSALLLDDQELAAELLAMTDRYTDDLFGSHAGDSDTVVTFPVSRLIVDPERFTDDAMESMAQIGMGVIYQRTSDGVLLRNPPSSDERKSLLRRFYEPHHEQLTEATTRELARTGGALVLDCHSFPSRPLPYETDRTMPRPDICLGTDPYHTPTVLLEIAQQAVADEGMTCAVNRPFAGSLVPTRFYQRDERVASIMVEVNRSLYMDEGTGERSGNYGSCRDAVGRILGKIRRWTSTSNNHV